MDDDMKLDAKTVKRLRNERAWSQEQLAEIADVSLRTIQRVEADGSASRETRMALAAAFGIDVRELAETVAPVPASMAPPLPPPAAVATTSEPPQHPRPPKHYGVVGLVAVLAALVAATGMKFLVASSPILTTVAPMIAIAGALYAGFGWYFSGRTPPSTPARRTAQFGFITCALVLLFSSFSASPTANAIIYLQMMLLACAIRFVFDWYFSSKQPRGPA